MIVRQHHLAKLAPLLPRGRRRGRVGGYPTYPKWPATANDEGVVHLPKQRLSPPINATRRDKEVS